MTSEVAARSDLAGLIPENPSRSPGNGNGNGFPSNRGRRGPARRSGIPRSPSPRRSGGRAIALGVAWASLSACASEVPTCSQSLFQDWSLQASYLAPGATLPSEVSLVGLKYGTSAAPVGPCGYVATVTQSSVSDCVERGGIDLYDSSAGCPPLSVGYILNYTTVVLVVGDESGWAVYGL